MKFNRDVKYIIKFSAVMLLFFIFGILIADKVASFYGKGFIFSFLTKESSASINISNIEKVNIPYELSFVKADLETYGYLSNYVISEYLKGIEDNYKYDKVPIGLSHAITMIESDYRFWIEHDMVNVENVKFPVRAIGASAIIWELWKDTLINRKIAATQSDLFIPYIAIRSEGCILKILIKQESQKGYDNLVNRVLIRYYGAYLQSRYDKTIKITSELWVKRMNRYLKQLGKEFKHEKR
jgi:hypothetical protein